ncbi:MAG: type III pantothenate kinase [Gammaproteobacteria bacterium]
MKLLVDVGNRRLKWASALDARGDFERSGALDFAGARELPALAAQWAHLAPDSVWVACVGAGAARQALARHVRETWEIEPVFICARARQAGVVNGYAQPAALGGDRWAALLAAGALHPRRALIVVDAGSAVTVDLLDCGVFRGGVILPGLRAMRAALARCVAHINAGADELPLSVDSVTSADSSLSDSSPPDSPSSPDAPLPHSPLPGSPLPNSPSPDSPPIAMPNSLATDTAAAVAAGAIFALAGGVELALARQRAALPASRRGECLVLATGGDAAQLMPLLAGEVTPAPQLVLRGLALIAGAAR